MMATNLDSRIASKLSARGIRGFDATKAERDRALGKIVKLGSPVTVMNQRLVKYGDAAKKA